MADRIERRTGPVSAVFFLLVLAPATLGQDVAGFEKRLTKFTLDNGLKFLVLERHEAPVVSFHTYADVGSVDEVKGITGVAHLFEHMAFKGTTTIGTKAPQAEAAALTRVDERFLALKQERQKGDKADPEVLKQLQAQFEQAQQEAQQYIVHDEYEEVLTQQGADGFNAYTSQDATQYIVSLPSNKLELWMMLEADRFAHAVLREFYKEKDVVMEERRMMENSPTGRLYEEFLGIAYLAHPYGEGVIGHMSDLQTLTRPEAEAFFRKYYGPSNLTIAVVGDVDPKNVRRLAQKYFAGIPSGPKPEPVETVEPPQRGERRVTVDDVAQPVVLIGYHQPGINHPDNAPLEVISEIVGVGRTSRLYKSLIKDKKIAVSASAGLNPSKYPSLFMFFVVPAKGHTTQECEAAVYAEIEKLKTEPVSAEELAKAKTRSRASVIRQLDSNSGLAAQLTFCEVVMGDWRNLFTILDRIEQVTAADVQRVAQTYFTRKNRSVGLIETAAEASR
ncbi:MAG: insulinase family protein [Planctomycetes bacterium]|jgi:predicted Zn-dependent peptidase|nr:insulinase family protein [Planctomycetota bacterium]